MIIKSVFIYVFLISLDVRVDGSPLEYTYDNLAGGWLKLHKPANREDAALRCDSDEGTLVSPVNSQVRDAVKNYLSNMGKAGLTIMSGVQADFDTGDYYSVEGVLLNHMPVTIQSGGTSDANSGESCAKWMTGKAEMGVVSCNEVLPFVCYKKRKSMEIAGCGTKDPEYKYDSRSGSCYKFHPSAQTWPKAYKICKREKGYLAVINDELENVVLTELFAKYSTSITGSPSDKDYASVGIRDWLDGEGWKTVTGKTISEAGYEEWADGEPNNGHGNEHCGSIYKKGKYNDADCNYKFAFICEKKPQIFYI